MCTYFVQFVGEGVLATWRRAEDFPVIHHQFVATRRSLPLRDCLQRTDDLNRGFKREGEGFVCLRDLAG